MTAFISASIAAPPTLQFRHLGIDDGLPASHVTDVLRDSLGFMWIGTAHGVSRYDSHTFRSYGANLGLVRQIYDDRAGELWVVTSSALGRYSRRNDAFVTIPARDLVAHAPSPVELKCISEDANGRLLVGSNVGVLAIDWERKSAIKLALDSEGKTWDVPVNALHLNGRGQLWAGTDAGLFLITASGAVEKHWLHVMGDDVSNDSVIRSLTTDKQGDLWIGTGYAGVARIDSATGAFSHYRHLDKDEDSLAGDRVARIIAERARWGVWIAMENGGVDRFDSRTHKFVHTRNDPSNPYSLGSNAVWGLFEDPAGLLWVGTFSAGLDISMPNGVAIRHYKSFPAHSGSLSANAVTGFLVDRSNRIWVATDGGGLNRLDPTTGRFERFTTHNTNLNSDAVLSIAQDVEGQLWVATWAGGVSRFDPTTRRFSAFTTKNSDISNDNIYEVVADQAGEIWIGTDDGLVAQLDRHRRSFSHRFNVVPPGFSWSSVLVLRELSDGRFAVGLREGGLTILDPRSGAQEHYLAGNAPDSALASNMVRSIFQSGENDLWIGTDAGVDRIDLRTRKTLHLEVRSVPAAPYIDGIMGDTRGDIWISSDNGLSRMDRKSGRIRTFNRADGLQANEFLMRSAYRAPHGTLFFGGNNGFNTIRPDLIVQTSTAPRVVLTDLLLFNHPVRVGEPGSPLTGVLESLESLRVSDKQNVLNFQFTALEYSAPGSVRYSYFMKGFDRDWQDARGRREATYTNLAPGRYTFQVRAIDVDEAWQSALTTLNLEVAPAVWQTGWFRILVALSIVGALTWLWRFQQKRRLEIELGRWALRDPLTGLASRLLFEERVDRAILRFSRAPDAQAALIYIDLDQFKIVNDSLGHPAGDEVLKVVAGRLLNCVRSSDTVARLGGDEFAILLEDLKQPGDARALAERIIEAAEMPILLSENQGRHEVKIGASIGIAFVGMRETTETLLKSADAAMYEAKSLGKVRALVGTSGEASNHEPRRSR